MYSSEFEEQKSFVTVVKLKYPNVLLCAQIAGINLGAKYGWKAKVAGYKKGWPDIFIAEPNKDYHGLFIEMKKRGDTKPTPDQKIVGKQLEERGYKFIVSHGWQYAFQELEAYILNK